MERQRELKALAEERVPLLVYNEEILNEVFFDLLAVPSVEKVFQSAEAAPYARILQKTLDLGAGLQCRSLLEMDRLSRLFHGLDPRRLLFVPARETREEYEQALMLGMHVVAGTEAWRFWPDIFEGRPVLRRVRIQSDTFTLEESISALPTKAAGMYLEVQGSQTASLDLTCLIPALHEQAGFLPDRHVLCLGGGTGLPIHPEKDTIMTPILSVCLEDIMERHAGLRIWVEPGRHLISHAGILLAKVTVSEENGRTKGGRLDLDGRRLMALCFAGGALPAVYKLTGPDQRHQVPVPGTMGDDSLDIARFPGPLSFSGKSDILVITNQGSTGADAEGPFGSVAKHFLKARRICQVKL